MGFKAKVNAPLPALFSDFEVMISESTLGQAMVQTANLSHAKWVLPLRHTGQPE